MDREVEKNRGRSPLDIKGGQGRHDFILQIFMAHKKPLSLFLKRTLVATEEVNDAMQEIYLRLLRLENIEAVQLNPKAYLFRIAANLVNDGIRKKYTRHMKQHFAIDEQELECSAPSPEENLDRVQQMTLLKNACDSLSAEERRIFFLHRVSKMTYQEISVEMGVSARTVRRLVVQTLSFLQDQLKRQGRSI